MESKKRMFIFDALSRSPVSDPPKDNGMAELEMPNERFIVNSISSQPSKDHEKAEEFGDMNLFDFWKLRRKTRNTRS